MSEKAARAADTRPPRALVLLAVVDALLEVMRDARTLGSLINPERDAKAYFARVYHRDPPCVHDWLTTEFLRYIRLDGDAAKFLSE